MRVRCTAMARTLVGLLRHGSAAAGLHPSDDAREEADLTPRACVIEALRRVCTHRMTQAGESQVAGCEEYGSPSPLGTPASRACGSAFAVQSQMPAVRDPPTSAREPVCSTTFAAWSETTPMSRPC